MQYWNSLHKRAAHDLGGSINPNVILTPHQSLVIRSLVVTASAITILSDLTTLYWLCRMRKSFRHRLILILILSNLFTTVWYFIFPLVAITHGSVSSKSAFCQASGYFTQIGTEASDFAVLCIAIHTALHIFQPAVSVFGKEGLYHYRYLVYTFSAALPILLGGLAFINPVAGYMSQGVICTLPVRPFWYRLALAWIPRYCIFFTIIGIYAAINIYVASKFKAFKNEMGKPPPNSLMGTRADSTFVTPDYGLELDQSDMNNHKQEQKSARFSISSLRKPSFYSQLRRLRKSDPSERRESSQTLTGSAQGILDQPSDASVSPSSSVGEDARDGSSTTAAEISLRSEDDIEQHAKPDSPSPLSSHQTLPNGDGQSDAPPDPTQDMRRRRLAIQRQLRYLFIYPLVYIAMWIIPFANHCLQYDDHYAQYPSYTVIALAFFCLSFMGTVNCVFFCWRETPWRHIPRSDGSLPGSFRFWRHHSLSSPLPSERSRVGSGGDPTCVAPEGDADANTPPRPNSPARVLFLPVTYRSPATPADRARQRLQMEYEERSTRRRSAERQRRGSFLKRGSRPREWFDRKSGLWGAGAGAGEGEGEGTGEGESDNEMEGRGSREREAWRRTV